MNIPALFRIFLPVILGAFAFACSNPVSSLAAVTPRPQVTVKNGGVEVPNGNWDSPYYLEPGSSMTFDLQFSIAQSPALGKFDPVNLVYGDPPFASDNHLFSFAHDVEGTVLKITVKRVDLPLYYSYDGRMRLIIKFDQDFVINGSDAGLVFQDYGENRIEDSQGYLYPGFYRTNTRAIRGLLP